MEIVKAFLFKHYFTILRDVLVCIQTRPLLANIPLERHIYFNIGDNVWNTTQCMQKKPFMKNVMDPEI